jgi:dihydrofolate synthase/folylpolyglutamate synthase
MNYQETLDWLFQQLASFQRVGQLAYKEDLGNISALCTALNHPQNNFKSIHIAGTNGKGSTCHLLASILQEQGYKVGLYTSPHLKDFRERVKVNGEMITESEVVDFVNTHQDKFAELGVSFFEMTTALAFEYFSAQKVDIAIIETGLGGRLDATNIILPELSVITNVALDHQNLLGDTIVDIATEKAGIIKEGVPVVLGLTSNEASSIVEQIAVDKGSRLTKSTVNSTYKTALLGVCQKENIATVCEVIEQLRILNWTITDMSIKNGFEYVTSNTHLRGRWEQIGSLPKVICDTGHNIHAITSIVSQLKSEVYDKLWIIVGVVGDKDVEGILDLLPKEAHYLFCQPSIPRALSVDDLEQKARKYLLKGIKVESPKLALKKAQELANENDLIFVGGSTFVVAEIL